VPGVLWSPAAEPARALVLLGHGGGMHKRSPGMRSQARSLVRHEAMAVAAMDAVDHGERISDSHTNEGTDSAKEPEGQSAERGSPEALRAIADAIHIDNGTIDARVADWSATIDVVLGDLGEVPVGYMGLSMGSIYGTAVTAADSRVRATVLGLSGIEDGTGRFASIGQRLSADSARIACPLLFFVQADHELVSRKGAFRQFDTLGSAHKRMHVNAGRPDLPRTRHRSSSYSSPPTSAVRSGAVSSPSTG